MAIGVPDRDLIDTIRAGTAVGVLFVDEPATVATELAQDPGTVLVAPAALSRAVAGARVRLAELVVERATQADPVDAGGSPATRTAQAHLRRQQAAWKVAWWERGEVPPEVAEWSLQLPAAVPVTLVAVDVAGDVDERAHATMTATAPAAVRVVVLQSR